jgi:hypothetical protein
MVTPFGCLEGTEKKPIYYDTFALDIESTKKGSMKTKLVYELNKTDTVDVKSAFGGFIMIRTPTLQKCSWNKSDVLCSEHNFFCRQVREYGRIVCTRNIFVFWSR